jgi:hypothetical protein
MKYALTTATCLLLVGATPALAAPQWVEDVDQKIINLDKETKRLSARDRAERDKAIADLKSQAMKAALGNTGLDLLGVVLIAVGIILSTLAS